MVVTNLEDKKTTKKFRERIEESKLKLLRQQTSMRIPKETIFLSKRNASQFRHSNLGFDVQQNQKSHTYTELNLKKNINGRLQKLTVVDSYNLTWE